MRGAGGMELTDTIWDDGKDARDASELISLVRG